MKIKRRPEDFQVEELTDVKASSRGEFALYRLRKQGVGTPEAVDAILKRWKLPRRRLAYGGLKDRHAVTTQFVTIHRGQQRNLEQTNLRLEYLGQVEHPFEPADIAGNRFLVVIRSLSVEAVEAAVAAVEDVRRDGVPNYFDDQRFGSVGPGGEFIARPWIDGNYERTLWLTLAEPHPFDRRDEAAEKQILRECWGNWDACLQRLARSHRRSIITFLRDRPDDFRGAWGRVRVDLRGLYLAAFQSYLWNRLLADLLRATCDPARLTPVELKLGPAPFFIRLTEEERGALSATELPLPSARTRLEPGPVQALVDRSLGELGLQMRMIRVKYPRDSFFSKGWRAATMIPGDLTLTSDDDELHSGRRKLTLAFRLPRGSYATILVKRLIPAVATLSSPDVE